MPKLLGDPELVEGPVTPIEGVTGGGFSEDGRMIVAGLRALSGQEINLQMPHTVASRLAYLLQQFSYQAGQVRDSGASPLEQSAFVPDEVVQAYGLDFKVSIDDEILMLVPTGTQSQPFGISLPIAILPQIKANISNTERSLKRLAKQGKKSGRPRR